MRRSVRPIRRRRRWRSSASTRSRAWRCRTCTMPRRWRCAAIVRPQRPPCVRLLRDTASALGFSNQRRAGRAASHDDVRFLEPLPNLCRRGQCRLCDRTVPRGHMLSSLHDRGVQLGRMSNRTCGPFSVSRALRSTLLPGTSSGCNRGVRLEVEPPTITRFFLALLNAQHAVGLLGVMESHPLDGVPVTGSTGAAGDADVQPRQPMKGSR